MQHEKNYKRARRLFSLALICALLFNILFLFWQEEYSHIFAPQYSINSERAIDQLDLSDKWGIEFTDKPAYFHFYDPDCKFSEINADHLKGLFGPYQDEVSFYFVIQGSCEDTTQLRMKMALPSLLTFIEDPERELAAVLGASHTPMAMILEQGSIYFQGGYSYGFSLCGSNNIKQSNPIVALDFVSKENPPPLLPKSPIFGCKIN